MRKIMMTLALAAGMSSATYVQSADTPPGRKIEGYVDTLYVTDETYEVTQLYVMGDKKIGNRVFISLKRTRDKEEFPSMSLEDFQVFEPGVISPGDTVRLTKKGTLIVRVHGPESVIPTKTVKK